MADNSGLEQRVAALEAELKAAKEANKPKPEFKAEPQRRFDPTERMGMPASAMDAMLKAVPDFRGIAAEQSRGLSRPGMFPSEAPREPVQKGSGWREPAKLEAPPGIRVMDQMLDVQDAVDRRDLERRLGVKRRI